jgi:hypothetical protein
VIFCARKSRVFTHIFKVSLWLVYLREINWGRDGISCALIDLIIFLSFSLCSSLSLDVSDSVMTYFLLHFEFLIFLGLFLSFIHLSLRTEHRASTVPRHSRLLFQFLGSIRHLVGCLGGGISPAQGLYLHRTTQHRKTQTNIHAPSSIRTCDPNVRAAEDSTWLRPFGHWDRHFLDTYVFIRVIL